MYFRMYFTFISLFGMYNKIVYCQCNQETEYFVDRRNRFPRSQSISVIHVPLLDINSEKHHKPNIKKFCFKYLQTPRYLNVYMQIYIYE